MRDAHPLERAVGMEYYVSETDGTGGRLRARAEDFRVREIERFAVEPVDAAPGSYPHLVFRATLSGWDTNDFASALSEKLGASRERVSWAGTKDKHAVTTQLFSLRAGDEIAPDDLPAMGDADIEVLGRAGRPVLFGDLAGNEFEAVVLDPDRPGNVAALTDELREFAGKSGSAPGNGNASGSAPGNGNASGDENGGRTVGVPNYFGQQRFGTLRPVTHEVGLAVVRGDWEGAVMAYLTTTTDREPEETRTARGFVRETRDWEAALDRLPGALRYERSMLHRLVETGGDDPGDFRAALETLPSNLQALFVNAAQSYAFNLMLSRRLERGLPFDRAVAGDVVCFADTDGAVTVPDTDRLQRVDEGRVETVNRHCERGRAFVTAPLVGTETAFGDAEPGEIERDVMDDLGLTREDFDLPGEFDSTGTRRAILVRTDLDVARDPLAFRFALPKGSYATVLLREYLKVDPVGLA